MPRSRALPRRGSLGFQKQSKSPGGPRTTVSAQPDPAWRSSWAPTWSSVKVSLHLFGDQFLLATEMSRGCKVTISQIAAERPGFILMLGFKTRFFRKLGTSSGLRPETPLQGDWGTTTASQGPRHHVLRTRLSWPPGSCRLHADTRRLLRLQTHLV